jgi:hypothetical protein
MKSIRRTEGREGIQSGDESPHSKDRRDFLSALALFWLDGVRFSECSNSGLGPVPPPKTFFRPPFPVPTPFSRHR